MYLRQEEEEKREENDDNEKKSLGVKWEEAGKTELCCVF